MMQPGFKGCVAAGHPATAEAGAEILRAGGNAVDAAIAAGCMSFIAEPVLTGAGGGGFMLIRKPSGASMLLDGFARMPMQRFDSLEQADFHAVPVDFGDTEQSFHIGRASVATPGLMSLLFTAHEQSGHIPMREILAPAVHAATHGVPLNRLQASFIHLLEPILGASDACRRLHSNDTGLLNEGDKFRNPQLGALLEFLGIEGVDDMYRGDVARRIVATVRPGGLLSMQDMEKAQAIQRTPISCRAFDGRLLSNPAPSAGGTLIAFSLQLLDGLAARRDEEMPLLLAAALAEASDMRDAGFDKHIHQPGFSAQFLHPDRLREHTNIIMQQLDSKKIFASHEIGDRHGSTTHVSVLDGDGMAVSMTASNGEGSGIVVEGTGIHLNNMLGEEDINPLGFHALPGGETLSSMMAPCIFEQQGRPALILGSGGSNRLRGAILQVLWHHLAEGMPIADAIRAPRIHNEGRMLDAEPDALTTRQEDALREHGWNIRRWSQPSVYFGGVHGIAVSASGQVQAGGDPRRGGAVAWA